MKTKTIKKEFNNKYFVFRYKINYFYEKIEINVIRNDFDILNYQTFYNFGIIFLNSYSKTDYSYFDNKKHLIKVLKYIYKSRIQQCSNYQYWRENLI